MPAYRTRDTRPLEVSVDALEAPAAPAFNIISPTPRAPTFSFAPNIHTPSPSPSNSPFEPDLRTLTLTPPVLAPSPSQPSPSEECSSLAAPPARPSHRRRRSTATDINERRPKKGDEDYVKRPENAFILFRRKCCEDRNAALGAAAVEAEETGATVPKRQRQADLSKAISAQWKALSPSEKQYWEDLARERKRIHAEQFPNYVYRPQRIKKGKAAVAGASSATASASSGKGKGKARADDEPETDSEIAFTLPVPAVPTRSGRRAASAPTPPPAHQTIAIPALYLPAQPTSPQDVPMISSRRASSVSESDNGPEPEWTFSSHLDEQHQFDPEGWRPDSQESESMFESYQLPASHTMPFGEDKCVPPLSISTDGSLYMPTLSFSSSTTASSGPPSPRVAPYSPDGQLETIAMSTGADLWQSAPLHLAESTMRGAPEPTHTFGYQPFSWAPGVWASGGEPLFNDHFDLSMIPPITLDVPKFDMEGCLSDNQTPPSCVNERESSYMHFELENALGSLQAGGDF